MTNHTCQAIVIRCLDFRLNKGMAGLLGKIGYTAEDYDLISVAGAGRDLAVGSSTEKEYLLKQIKTSVELHQSGEIVILMHDDCGAYRISDPAEEEKVQKEHLEQITDLLKEKFSQTTVRTFIIKGTKTGQLEPREISRR